LKAVIVYIAVVCGVLTVTFTVSGCEEDVVAVLGIDDPFSLYGVLTPQADTQWVRVYAIDDALRPITGEPLDAVFESAAGSDSTITWTDSVVVEGNGMFAHVFYAPFAAAYGQDYSISVTRSDGLQSTVDVAVPPFSELLLPPQSATAPAVLRATITGDPPNLIRVEVTYEYIFRSLSDQERLRTTFSYDGEAEPAAIDWTLPIQVARDTRAIRNAIKESTGLDPEIKVVKITVRMIVANIEWNAPGGAFDPEILVEPGLMSNVEGGFGFVGAGFRLEGSWVPADTILVKTSF
jgi:hypothetical protein